MVKHRFCPLCREWYAWGYGYTRHKCCKKYPALKLEFGWEAVEQLKGKEYVAESQLPTTRVVGLCGNMQRKS